MDVRLGGALSGAPKVASRRTFGLDLLRAGAIVVVLANHLLLGMWNRHWPVAIEGGVAHFSTTAILSIEWLFVLSGFLIGAMMIRSFERPGSFWSRARDFWLRRWFRTMPMYFLFIAVNAALVAWGLAPGRFSWHYLVFAQNLWAPPPTEFYPEAWSLALDEWFYLVMPLLVGLCAVLGRRLRWGLGATFLAATLILIVIPLLARATIVPTDYLDWDRRVRIVTLQHLDATGWGVLAAVASRWLPDWWGSRRGAKAVLGLAMMVLGIVIIAGHYTDGWLVQAYPRLANVVGLGLLPAGTFLMLPWIAALPSHRGVGAVVDFLSTYSYTIYLSHVPLLMVAVHLLGAAETSTRGEVVAASAGWLAAVLVVSVALYHAFEKPTSDLRERFTRKVDANPFTP